MRALELFRNLTLGKKLFVVGMALSLSTAAHSSEVADSTRPVSDLQHKDLMCKDLRINWRTTQTDFTKACAAAGLSGTESRCKKQLEDCTESNHKGRLCIGNATNRDDHRENLREERDQKRELQERKDKLMADYQEKQDEIQRAKVNQDLIQKELQATLVKVDNAKAQAQLDLEIELQKSLDHSANTKDAIDLAQLKLSEAVVNNSSECRKKALAEKDRYILQTRGRAITANQLFGRTGLTVNQSGSIRYEKVLSNCKALYTDTGKTTDFGEQYAQLNKTIEIEKSKLRRALKINRRNRTRVIRNTKQALAVMDQQKQAAYINAQNENFRAQQNVELLLTQRNGLMAQINELNGDMEILGTKVRTSTVMAAAELGWSNLRGRKAAGKNKEKVAKQDKIEAYNKALGIKDSIENAQGDFKDQCDSAKDGATIAKSIDTYDISGSVDTTTAVATEIDSNGRTPAASVGQTL